MRGVKQPRRKSDFFQQNFNSKAAGQMSEFCKEAHIIYDLWDGGEGSEELFEYLVNNIGCSKNETATICSCYKPVSPPEEVCPVNTIKHGSFNEVFKRLSLQLPSLTSDNNGAWPKNLLAWVLMRKVYGEESFNFELFGTGATGDNKILFSRVINGPDGNPIPFGLAALNVINVGELPAHAVKKAEVLTSSLGQAGIDLAKTLLEADFIFPPRKTLQQLIEIIRRGNRGETIILSGAFCPDYAYRKSDRPGMQYEYTFDNVGTGIGLVAKQFQRVLPFITKYFDDQKIKYRIKLGIGDFEANSKEILAQVGISRDEFIACCTMSLDAFQKALPDIPMELHLFEQNWANGRWKKYIGEAHQAMLDGDFGQIKANTGKDPKREVEFIARDSASFYRRWYNCPEMSLKEVEDLVIGQSAEYVAMGRVLKEDFDKEPFIQIAGDRPKMQIFNSFVSCHPTLCCKRTY